MLSVPGADQSFIILMILVIPEAVIIIGTIASAITGRNGLDQFRLCSRAKIERKAWLKASAEPRSLSGISKLSQMVTGVFYGGFIAFQNCLGIALSRFSDFTGKNFPFTLRTHFVAPLLALLYASDTLRSLFFFVILYTILLLFISI